MSYTDRWIKFKKEETWGTWNTPDTFPNYLLDWSATTTENKEEEDLIAGSRDYKKRVWLEEGVVGKWTQELVSAKMFEYILGSKTSSDNLANTYSVGSTLPCMSIYRGISQDESGDTLSIGYTGMKIDTAELTIEEKGDVRLVCNFAGKGATIPTPIVKGTINMNINAFAFHNSSIDLIYPGPTTLNLDEVSRLVITINNNLDARYSAGALSYKPTELREGLFEVSGRVGLYGDLTPISSIALNREDCTLKVTLAKTGSTIVATLKNITFDELPDEISGLESIEMEIPFKARPSSGSDAIVVVENTSSSFAVLPY